MNFVCINVNYIRVTNETIFRAKFTPSKRYHHQRNLIIRAEDDLK